MNWLFTSKNFQNKELSGEDIKLIEKPWKLRRRKNNGPGNYKNSLNKSEVKQGWIKLGKKIN